MLQEPLKRAGADSPFVKQLSLFANPSLEPRFLDAALGALPPVGNVLWSTILVLQIVPAAQNSAGFKVEETMEVE